MSGFAIHTALEAIWRMVGEGDVYISAQAPWVLKKTDPARMGNVLYNVAELIRRLAILAQPAMPSSCAALLDQLAVPTNARDFASLDKALQPGTLLPSPQGVFPRWVEPVEA